MGSDPGGAQVGQGAVDSGRVQEALDVVVVPPGLRHVLAGDVLAREARAEVVQQCELFEQCPLWCQHLHL